LGLLIANVSHDGKLVQLCCAVLLFRSSVVRFDCEMIGEEENGETQQE
jgi:hypothetical protein